MVSQKNGFYLTLLFCRVSCRRCRRLLSRVVVSSSSSSIHRPPPLWSLVAAMKDVDHCVRLSTVEKRKKERKKNNVQFPPSPRSKWQGHFSLLLSSLFVCLLLFAAICSCSCVPFILCEYRVEAAVCLRASPRLALLFRVD